MGSGVRAGVWTCLGGVRGQGLGLDLTGWGQGSGLGFGFGWVVTEF